MVVTALLALLAIWLTRDNVERHLYEMSTSQTISGLQPQAAVRFRGVPGRRWKASRFDQSQRQRLDFGVIDRAAPVTQSTFAAVASQGVTGLGFIQLDDNSGSTPAPDAQRRRPAAHSAAAQHARQVRQQSQTICPGRTSHHAAQSGAV